MKSRISLIAVVVCGILPTLSAGAIDGPITSRYRLLGSTVEDALYNKEWTEFNNARVMQISKDGLLLDTSKYGIVWLKNYPKSDQLIDDATINVSAKAAGVHEYVSVLGANKRVLAFDYGKEPSVGQIAEYKQKKEAEWAALRAAREEKERTAESLRSEEKRQRDEQVKKLRDAQTARVVAYQQQQASNGYGSFQFELGKRYLRGDGVETNRILALHWLKSACTNGLSEATNLLSKIQ